MASQVHRSNAIEFPQEGLFVRIKDVATTLSLSERMVAKLIYAGQIPSMKFGRTIRIPATWLTAKVQEIKSL